LAIRRKIFGNEHPEVANILNSLSAVLEAEGKFAEAERALREMTSQILLIVRSSGPNLNKPRN
jgi:hypothetical protein